VTERAARAGGPGAEAAQPTREAILDAAERLFSAHGVDGVAVRDLARELGLTPSSLYNHFPSKQALYEAVLERGIKPVVDLIASEQHQTVDRESVARVVDTLVAHLAQHPQLPKLLQRAMLAESNGVQELFARWLSPLYRGGFRVVGELAPESGWEPDEVPHVAIGLFALIMAYFVNAEAMARLVGWRADVMSPKQLAAQRRFLERAILRMLSPRIGQRTRRRRSDDG
jgi:AcrR family transcriptional regulator